MASEASRARGEARRATLMAMLGLPRPRAASLQELADELGWSNRLVHYHLGILARRGAVQNLGGARGYVLAPDADCTPCSSLGHPNVNVFDSPKSGS